MRLLGLDVGEKRIGVALSDAQGIVARPAEVLLRRSKREDFETIERLVRKWDIERIVVGLPLTAENEIGPQARNVKRYARELGRAVSIPIDFVDERYSTVDALEVMRTAGHSRKKQRERVDAVAAAILLESYLDNLRKEDEGGMTVSGESHDDVLAT